MFINPIVLGAACTIGGLCVLITLGLAVSTAKYVRRNGLNLPTILRLIQIWAEDKPEQ